MAKQRLLLDTNVIIEAFRIKCWKALSSRFAIETVETCVIECSTGDSLRPGYIPIPLEELRNGLSCEHRVEPALVATLLLECEDLPVLDAGELHLMAWLHAHPTESVLMAISTADAAAVRATHVLNLLDRVASLQELGKQAGVGGKQLDRLKSHFHEDWLSRLRTQLIMHALR